MKNLFTLVPWLVLTGLSVLMLAHPVSASGAGWNSLNDPRHWSQGYEYRLEALPLEGRTEGHTPWSDTYWPSREAGIAARWNWSGQNGFNYRTFSESAVRAMTPGQLAHLSPAEKYDIFMGRFDYPTVRRIRAKTSPHAQGWEGICHGWSPAALNHAEPAPVELLGPSGILVPFGSADVKALLDEQYAEFAIADAFLGARCRKGPGGGLIGGIVGFFSSPSACEDVNPGALHVILANELGVRHQGFVADVDRSRQVWNQPVYGFQSRIVGRRAPSKRASPGTAEEVLVHTEMLYAVEIDPAWAPVVGTDAFRSEKAVYDYALELDASGRIIGGRYHLKSNPRRPDFLWRAPKLEFTGPFEGLGRIYQPAVAQ